MRIITFNFDGTLSGSEMTVLLGKKGSMADETADIIERAVNDEMSYVESLRSRACLPEGLEEEPAEEAYGEVGFRPDAASLIQCLRDYGHHVAIFADGFERDVERTLEEEDVEIGDIVSSHLPVKGGQLTSDMGGSLIEDIKDTTLEIHAAESDVPIDRTVAVGDGANDLPMFEVTGLSVGFAPKDAAHPAYGAAVASMDRLGKLFESHGILDTDE